MNARTQDGSAGDVDYGSIGSGYSSFRRPDSRVAQVIARPSAVRGRCSTSVREPVPTRARPGS